MKSPLESWQDDHCDQCLSRYGTCTTPSNVIVGEYGKCWTYYYDKKVLCPYFPNHFNL